METKKESTLQTIRTGIHKEKIYIDNQKNSLYVETGDDDGFLLSEDNDTNRVYIYFSDLPKLIPILQEINQCTI